MNGKLEWMIDKRVFATSPEDVSHPGLVIGPWTVHDGESSVPDPLLKIELFEQAMSRLVDTPEVLVVHGHAKHNVVMNGIYCRGNDLHEGEVYYEKLEGAKQ